MSHTEELQQALVLHARPWRETSLIVDLFTEHYGKIAVCARGVRSKKSPKRSMLQPLSPLYICWKGRGELPTLTVVEAAEPAIKLSGTALYSSFYINELLTRLLHKYDPHPELFNHYKVALNQLSVSDNLEQTLREFELELLVAIGYGLTLDYDSMDQPISELKMYFLNTEGQLQNIDTYSNENIGSENIGSEKMDSNKNSVNPRLFTGRQLISISERNWHDKVVLKDAKRLLRISLKPLLGDKPLQSRKLFRSKTS
jgi:DNA repair protein RecO (recombination protein O)